MILTRRPTVFPDVPYAAPDPAAGAGHLLDLHLPATQSRDAPLLVWTGGSGWLGDRGKDSADLVAPFFTARGWAVAGVSVRSSRQARFPGQLHDLKAAIRRLRADAGRLGLDPGRFAVMGDSSGGWAAAMAAVTGGLPRLEGTIGETSGSSRVQAAVDLFGPTDFLAMDRHMPPGALEAFNVAYGLTGGHEDPRSPESLLLGSPVRDVPDLVARANPVTYVGPSTPPILVVHGALDAIVPQPQSDALYAAMHAAGRRCDYHALPAVGHDRRRVLDPRHHAGNVLRSTAGGTQREGGAPGPTLEVVAAFLDEALGL